MLSSECQGARICTSFGWCRGKVLCYDSEVKSACKVVEKKTCKTDDDCYGSRLCDDYDGKCDGEDSIC